MQKRDASADGGASRPSERPELSDANVDERLIRVLRTAAEVTGASGAVAWLTQRGSDDLVARLRLHGSVAEATNLRCRIGEGVVGSVVASGRAAVIEHVSEASPVDRDRKSRRVEAVLVLPLMVVHHVLGALDLEFTERTNVREDDARLVELADHLTALVHEADLAAESRERGDELERKDLELRELDHLKADFLSMVSHELRTPLTAIIGYTDLLLREVHGPLNERQQQHQNAVKKAAHRLLTLINDVLDVSRLESGHMELAPEPTPLGPTFEQALAEVQGVAGQGAVELRLDVATRLPPVVADVERLKQVLVNLLDNAIKFTPADGTVTVRAARDGDAVHVCVVDTGAGVPPEQLERLWDRFHQVDSSTRRRHGGTGLGLAIVRNLVQLHNGNVCAHSPGVGRGSTFCFSLPISHHPLNQPGPPPVQRESSTIRLRILIVDDEPDNREVIASVVCDVLGHEALIAEDGEQALEVARLRPDVVLLDLRLPGMTGFEVATRLKSDPTTSDIPILAITALSEPEDQQAALEAGCVGCITKPFTSASLIEAITQALSTDVTRGDGTAD